MKSRQKLARFPSVFSSLILFLSNPLRSQIQRVHEETVLSGGTSSSLASRINLFGCWDLFSKEFIASIEFFFLKSAANFYERNRRYLMVIALTVIYSSKRLYRTSEANFHKRILKQAKQFYFIYFLFFG